MMRPLTYLIGALMILMGVVQMVPTAIIIGITLSALPIFMDGGRDKTLPSKPPKPWWTMEGSPQLQKLCEQFFEDKLDLVPFLLASERLYKARVQEITDEGAWDTVDPWNDRLEPLQSLPEGCDCLVRCDDCTQILNVQSAYGVLSLWCPSLGNGHACPMCGRDKYAFERACYGCGFVERFGSKRSIGPIQVRQ